MGNKFLWIILMMALSNQALYAQTDKDKEQAEKYKICLSNVNKEDQNAVVFAKKWYVEGGGAAAQHCEAMALYNQDRFDEAAELLEEVADKVSRGDEVGAFASKNKELLSAQLRYIAGNAWRGANMLERAYSIYTAALLTLDDRPSLKYDFYIERGLVQLDRGEHQDAINDFGYALELNEERTDAFLYRAETYRKMNDHLKSRLDLNQGLSIDPMQPDLIFESGVNYRMLKQDLKAKNEWQKLIDNYPDSKWKKLAEDNIKLIND